MSKNVVRLFVEKKAGFNVEADSLFYDLKDNLGIRGIEKLRILNRYDISGISIDEYEKARDLIFSEVTVDNVYEEQFPIEKNSKIFAIEYLPGQYDQRADSACQCIQLLTQGEEVAVNTAKVIVLQGDISEEDFDKVKKYCINPVDSREACLEKSITLNKEMDIPKDIAVLEGFIDYSEKQLEVFLKEYGLAMSFEDLKFCREYFKNTEKRNPTLTEIKVIDTYWSDHCRHTTFLTTIEEVSIEESEFSKPVIKAHEEYLKARDYVYEGKDKEICLMDIAVIGMKELRKRGFLEDLDVSEEINACSIEINVDVNGKDEKWLLMFKNETHNHPTEIEPFGGAATCLGGAIRDPLSGRAYVYQAMRVTGSGDPRTSIEDTLQGKLPQRKITLGAAQGYSSYGNQIGLATGQVAEVYDEGFVAKRMELGAVIAAALKENVVRKEPKPSDVVVLIGGRTGRDGCGGATGSSKEHDETSILNCGAEVQKGNPVTERKIQRLFRNPEVSKMIKRCNDFGAGGVSVAIGELTESLEINLDLVPKKYEGLDGTELAISESQERMAVVIDEKDVSKLISLAHEENLEATVVAKVTDDKRLKMSWRDKYIVNLSREFLNTNGVRQSTKAIITAPSAEENYFNSIPLKVKENLMDIKKAWLSNLQDLNICSQKGLVERFDSTIGAGTVLMPFGGKYQAAPSEGMAAKIPVINGETKTVSLMTYGYNPKIGKWSPFHGAVYSIVEAAAKLVAMGGDYKNIRLSLQEYFEKLGKDPVRWGKPLAALLGALHVQRELSIAAIGGKDSMSGSFKDLNVPPTLVAFAVGTTDIDNVISIEFKSTNSQVVLIPCDRDEQELPRFDILKRNFSKITELIKKGKILSACSVKGGGISEAVSKMCFGNMIGMKFIKMQPAENFFKPDYGSFIVELSKDEELDLIFEDIRYELLGYTQENNVIEINNEKILLEEAFESYESTLESIFKTKTDKINENIENISFNNKITKTPTIKLAKPRVFIPVFPGTNCEYDSQRVFEKAGAAVETLIFKNLSAGDIENSIEEMVKKINNSQIVMLPGGFSAGDEPDGSGKFIAAVFRNERVKTAVMNLLNNRDGLMLGICNGFQALIKLGLVPYGEIRALDENCPTLTYNSIGRHVSCMVQTKITSKLSPWFNNVNLGDIHTIPVSHGEGRFVCSEEEIKRLIANGQVATQYVDFEGNATYDIKHNPNGSFYAVEGITSPDGRVLGKMGHSERVGYGIAKNIAGEKNQRIFEAGVNYFK
ncbi:phosphoribosylformylglycinamidine synthase [Clostridium sp. SYSU_GA19001]|uniref:phosphoribosylformylglycinamidine synthase n=1 Tax=Clostridium caldaquaticum TaxID=2940653 RepID=UPI00207732FE|nr:phosphoribosylformylglycinamidine synthase [Clostridium caldaquaticum]MCM8710079.1 phosphoribosylformylglycinamidine synthase [Clostridium caldaquaticum]